MTAGPTRPKADFDFRDLLRHPEKLFGYGYLYFLAAAMLIGVLYVGNLSTIGKRAAPVFVPTDSSAFQKDIAFQTPRVLPPVDAMTAGVASDSLVRRGAGLYTANCASCHGDNGGGDGPAGLTLNPKPRNFRSLAGWTNGSKVSQIYRTLEEGIVRNGMASYSYLPPADRFAIAHYVRTFAQDQPMDSAGELQALETAYQLSKGSAVAGRIPVKTATAIVLAEQGPRRERLRALISAARTDADPGAEVYRRVAAIPEAVFVRFLTGQAPDVRRFLLSVEKDPIAAGFRTTVLHLRPEEWVALHGYLAGKTAGEGGS
jgi:mono/diheme cytochrome c family protein